MSNATTLWSRMASRSFFVLLMTTLAVPTSSSAQSTPSREAVRVRERHEPSRAEARARRKSARAERKVRRRAAKVAWARRERRALRTGEPRVVLTRTVAQGGGASTHVEAAERDELPLADVEAGEQAAPPVPEVEPPAAASVEDEPVEMPPFTVRGSLDWISSLAWTAPRRTPLNPHNAVLRIPRYVGTLDLRPTLRFQVGSWLSAVAQPRFMTAFRDVYVSGARQPLATTTRAEIVQLFATLQLGRALALSYGYQTVQWGPAELIAPSNRLFRLVNFGRSPLFVLRGRNLARLDLKLGPGVSVLIAAELLPNHDRPFMAGERFERQGLAKLELRPEGSASYVGLSGGMGRRTRPWVGEYGSFSVTEALALYVDATHTLGSRALYPARDDDGVVTFSARRQDERRLRTLAIAGARYTFGSGPALRAEYVYHDAGYTRTELRLAHEAAAASPPDPAALAAYDAPGLDLLARHAGSLSLRLPGLPPRRSLAVQLRYLLSLTDRGGSAFASLGAEVVDSLIVFLSAVYSHGPSHAELSRYLRGSVIAGALYAL